ncbi:GNAT family N-acetyltransferase [Neobacillus sp. NPDC093182]|uniref:GNAT family N-acetyltransferase n=1 Tax=Neobacillus sp. NPDC093182 TaxID=3364297 RepID=UPI00381BD3C7
MDKLVLMNSDEYQKYISSAIKSYAEEKVLSGNWNQQGFGYGKEAMKKIEIVGQKLGMKKIGLHVFGHNKVARGLYDKLGYQTTNVLMEKEI